MVDKNTQPSDVIKTIDDFRQSIIDNKAVIHAYDEKYKQAHNSDEAWIVSGAVASFESSERGLTISLPSAKAILSWINPSTLHVMIRPTHIKDDEHFSYLTVDMPEYSDEPVNFQDNDDEIIAIKIDPRITGNIRKPFFVL